MTVITKENGQIRKAHKISGRTLVFRNAEISDAPFILSLRVDREKSRYLSPTSPEISQQVAWLEDYAEKSDQAYFIIETKEGLPLGMVRIYDAVGDSFCWGSWILKDEAPRSAAIESALMVYSYALDHLGFRGAHQLNVRKGNVGVVRFHESFGAERISETEDDFIYEIIFEKIVAIREKAKMYLPENVKVDWDGSGDVSEPHLRGMTDVY